MKILLCNSSFGGGGITSYAHEVIKCFKNQHKIDIMVGSDMQNPINYKDVRVHKYEMSDTSTLNAEKILRIINDEIKPDLIINSNAYLISLLVPYISNTIGVVSISHALKYNDADVAGFNAQYQDAIIALSQHGKKHLERRFGIKDGDKVKVVSNFIQDNNCRSIWIKQKIEREKLNIVFSGGGSAVKSPNIVARTVRELLKTDLDFNFYWLGNTIPPLHKISILKDIRQLFKNDDRLIFTGKVPRNEAKKIIGEANIFLFPSIREGCPMSLLEAMSIGTIPIVADYPQVNIEIIKDGENGFVVNHKKPEVFADLIQAIIRNHNEYLNIYENSYKTYKDLFSYTIWKKNMNQLLRELKYDHIPRKRVFDESSYNKSERAFRKMLRNDTLKAYLNEATPVSLSLLREYIKSKL